MRDYKEHGKGSKGVGGKGEEEGAGQRRGAPPDGFRHLVDDTARAQEQQQIGEEADEPRLPK